jgi:hypothetical protein
MHTHIRVLLISATLFSAGCDDMEPLTAPSPTVQQSEGKREPVEMDLIVEVRGLTTRGLRDGVVVQACPYNPADNIIDPSLCVRETSDFLGQVRFFLKYRQPYQFTAFDPFTKRVSAVSKVVEDRHTIYLLLEE